ncbi:FAD-dependent oxidoreductase [Paenibacillus sp. CGMCC 1.16610]|uniref:Pyridine nucleotide-disulfide oxidoreductase n=1 Tax=Paenibacillus anseongense TaxID=2682845 RepID=A0ABW9UGJ8_9BACL|nr:MULTISPECIES: FAD-dependent oxidoreductase [Paenibacillus]MBA2939633.1 FAD-dependent oxidoreductase [Paenibacillus sp. CGMCC 1.16610]MVQ39294.1 pyridine nucleotide-disulfide oxidoreductase [Paenibacillus anseongense]
MIHYDAVIIGFGKGGKTLAAALAKKGQKVAIIEQSELMYGGTCINIGCIPTKALVHYSKQSQLMNFKDFDDKSAVYRLAIDKKTTLVTGLRQKNYDNLDNLDKVTIYTGKAKFESSHEIAIQSSEELTSIYGEQIYINTGASTIIPAIEGASSSKHVYTSTSLMELTNLPKKMVVLGAGYIGLEFSSIYANFGSEIVVLDKHSEFLSREDRDIANMVQSTLEKRGIDFKLGTEIQSIRDVEHGVVVTYRDQDNNIHELYADAVLIAAGRKPNTEGLQLQKAGIAVTDRGAIKVDERLQTTIPHIYAMGDVVGGFQFTYISLDDQRIILDNLYGSKQRTTEDRLYVPYSVFIDPPLSRVGLSEDQALAKGYEIKLATMPAAAIPRAKLTEETDGLLKVIVDAKTDRILGCSLFCSESHEMINIVQIAMETGQPYTYLRDHIFTHPTMSESLNDLFQLIK